MGFSMKVNSNMQISSTTEAMQHLIELAVAKFQKDYPKVNYTNIFTDYMYGQFFRQSLVRTQEGLPTAKQVLNQQNTKAMTYYHNAILILINKIDKNLNLIEDD